MTARARTRCSIAIGAVSLAIGVAILSLCVRAAYASGPVLLPLLSPGWATSKLAPSERVMIQVGVNMGWSYSNCSQRRSLVLGRWVHRFRTTNGGNLTVHVFESPEITRARSWGVFLGDGCVCWWLGASRTSAVIGSTKPQYVAAFAVPFFALGGRLLFVGLRRTRRLRAGACIACGYSLAGLAAARRCPECGAAPIV